MYLLNKFLYSIITLFGVVTVIFFLFSVLPGDPAQMMLGQNDNSEQLVNIKKKYAFDKPVSEQYLLYINDLSPLSIHSKNIDDYTFLEKNKYNHKTIFQTNSSVFLIISLTFLPCLVKDVLK